MHRRRGIGIGLFVLMACGATAAFGDIAFRVRPMVRNDIPPGRGVCEIRLQVDDAVEVILDGDRVVVRNLAGQEPRDEGSACNMPLPRREVEGFNFVVRESRTPEIRLVEGPTRANGGRVIVRIHDEPGGFGRYIFEVNWFAGERRDGGERGRDDGDRLGPERRDGEYGRDMRIIRAVWGVPGRDREVTALLQERVHDGVLRMRVTNEEIGFDPAYGEVKSLFVMYEVRGRRQEVRVPEGEFLQIP